MHDFLSGVLGSLEERYHLESCKFVVMATRLLFPQVLEQNFWHLKQKDTPTRCLLSLSHSLSLSHTHMQVVMVLHAFFFPCLFSVSVFGNDACSDAVPYLERDPKSAEHGRKHPKQLWKDAGRSLWAQEFRSRSDEPWAINFQCTRGFEDGWALWGGKCPLHVALTNAT